MAPPNRRRVSSSSCAGFAFGLLLLAPVFYPVLAWGDSRYQPTSTP